MRAPGAEMMPLALARYANKRVVWRHIRLSFEGETITYQARVIEPESSRAWPEALGNDLSPAEHERIQSWYERATAKNPVKAEVLDQPGCQPRYSYTAR